MRYKYSFSMISKLYSISLFWFGGTIIMIMYVLLNFIFPTTDFMIRGKNGTYGKENIFKNGYSVPVTITINMPADTIIQYSKNKTNGQLNLRNGEFFRSAQTDSILNDTTLKKETYYYKWVAQPSISNLEIYHNVSGESEIDLFNNQIKYHSTILNPTIEDSYTFDSSIKIIPKNIRQKIILLIGYLVSVLFYFLVSFQFMKIIKQLNKRISFVEKIYKRLNIVGIAIIANEILQLLIGLIYSKWYGAITLLESSTTNTIHPFQIQFNPSSDFSFVMIIFGIGILVLSYIFKYGNKIEEENALTV